MKIITMILVAATSFLNLLEGEGRIFRKAVMRLGWAVVFIALASLLVLASAGFLLFGIYQYFNSQMPPVAAALLVSLSAFVLALLFAGVAKWRIS